MFINYQYLITSNLYYTRIVNYNLKANQKGLCELAVDFIKKRKTQLHLITTTTGAKNEVFIWLLTLL